MASNADLNRRLAELERALAPDKCGCACHETCSACGCHHKLEFCLDGFTDDEIVTFGQLAYRARANARRSRVQSLVDEIQQMTPEDKAKLREALGNE